MSEANVGMTKPSYKRAERVADQIRMEVADILARKTKDTDLIRELQERIELYKSGKAFYE